jgi:hypothetical protein
MLPDCGAGDAGKSAAIAAASAALARAARATLELTAASSVALAAGFAASSAQTKSVGTSKKATAIVAIFRAPNLIVVSWVVPRTPNLN